jgi:hypothetical protein
MAEKTTKTVLSCLLLLVPALFPGGCASKPASPVTYMRPELLYLKDQPHARLYVEVDRMEGVSLPEYWVEELKTFLGHYCLKPDGIEVVLDPPLPAVEFQDLPLSLASILCIDGPLGDDRPPPAYLHVFVFDGKTMFRGAMPNPYVLPFCPSGVFWNVAYARSWPAEAGAHMLRHELGHVLGLCHNTAHGDGSHCRNSGCLMHWTPDPLLQLTGIAHLYFKKHQLCEECEHDLSVSRQGPPDKDVSFAGPFLIRRADGYCVASLPFFHTIMDEPAVRAFDWKRALIETKRDVRQSVRDRAARSRDSRRYNMIFYANFYDPGGADTSSERPDRRSAVLTRATNDPCPSVRSAASGLLKREHALCAPRP